MFEMRKDPYGRRAPRALLTAFGWTIVGPATSPKEEEQYCLRTGPSVEEDSASELSRIIDNLILTDDLVSNAKPPVPAEETRAKGILEKTTKFIGDRFESRCRIIEQQFSTGFIIRNVVYVLIWP